MKILKTANYKKIEKEAYVPARPTYMGNATKWKKDDYPTGECSDCGKRVMEEYIKRYDGKCRSCFEKNKKKAQSIDPGMDILDMDDNGGVSPIYVSIYDVERGYGGPEEGGWGYDHLTFTGENTSFNSFDEAINFSRQKNNEFKSLKENKVAKVEDYPGENETQSKPHYE